MEASLLVCDYRLMRGWYALTHAACPEQARRALLEMADVLSALAVKLREGTAPVA